MNAYKKINNTANREISYLWDNGQSLSQDYNIIFSIERITSYLNDMKNADNLFTNEEIRELIMDEIECLKSEIERL